MIEYVSNPERQYLVLAARRTLNWVKQAADRGEEYHDIQAPIPLACGHRAKLRFVAEPGGYYAAVEVWLDVRVADDYELALTIANQVLNAKTAISLENGERHYVFRGSLFT